MAWTERENEVAIAAYFDLMVRVFNGERVVKSELYRRVSRALDGKRNSKSVERKFQNYSYVLQRMGHPYVPGLKPYSNIQRVMMPAMVEEYIADHDPFSRITYPEAGPSPQDYLDKEWDAVYDRAPPPLEEDGPPIRFNHARVLKIDFAARDARNRALGRAGEAFVVDVQRRILSAAGREDLAIRVQNVAEVNDAVGYDVMSYQPDGRQRLIEVKTTPYPATTPFYLTSNELQCSLAHPSDYELHRVYNWKGRPRVFILPPPLESRVHLEPIQYRARF